MTMAPADSEIIARLKAGDEATFLGLVRRHQDTMIRVSMRYCRSRSVAEEIVQDSWVAVLDGLDRFEGRSSFKTWMYRIVVNRSITRAKREGKVVPLSSMAPEGEDKVVDPSRFSADGSWVDPPLSWGTAPDRQSDDEEIKRLVTEAIAKLPERQGLVIKLRDVQGLSGEDVCNLLDISPTNQRVLLHRARSKVRELLEDYYRGRSK